MAIWQFDVTIARSLDERQLPRTLARLVHAGLTALLGEPEEMLDGWEYFGDKYCSRVDFGWTEDGGCELSARIDAREEADVFISALVTLADPLELRFFDENGATIPATHEALQQAVMQSEAWRFALDANAWRQAPGASGPMGGQPSQS